MTPPGDPHPSSDATRRRRRWAARPVQAWLVRASVFAAPLVGSFVFVHYLSQVIAPPTSSLLLYLLWWGGLSGMATVILFVIERLSRRLLPLSALLSLSLVFPDETPSRLKTALRSGNVRSLRKRLELTEEAKAAATPQEAATLLLELVAGLNLHDRLTRGHSERVRAYSVMIGKELGLKRHELDLLNWAALIHDIGKLDVPASILTKAGAPSEAEWDVLRRHPLFGEALTVALADWLGEWRDAVGYHHERWDGKGYPRGVEGKDLPLAGRIVAVADAFDVITSARSYKAPSSSAAARAEIARHAGTQFDPQIVRTFLNVSLGRMRMVMGPLSWLSHAPILARIPLTPAVASLGGTLAVVGSAAAAGAVMPAHVLPHAHAGTLVAAAAPAHANEGGDTRRLFHVARPRPHTPPHGNVFAPHAASAPVLVAAPDLPATAPTEAAPNEPAATTPTAPAATPELVPAAQPADTPPVVDDSPVADAPSSRPAEPERPTPIPVATTPKTTTTTLTTTTPPPVTTTTTAAAPSEPAPSTAPASPPSPTPTPSTPAPQAARLSFTTYPDTAVRAGTTFAVEVAVEAADGTVVTGDDSTSVSLTVTPGTGIGALTCPAGESAVVQEGRATFHCSIATAGAGYMLSASTAASLAPATGGAFAITAGPATRLTFVSPAVSGPASAGAALGPIRIEEQDAYGNPVAADAGGEVVTLASSSANGTFSASRNGPATATATIPGGASTITVYYGDEDAGAPTITAAHAAAPALGSATQQETIAGSALGIAPTTLTAPAVGTAFSQALTPSGSAGPFSFTLTGGQLPPGIALDPSGTLGGTPTAAGPYTFTVGVTDGHGGSGSQTYSLTVAAPVITFTLSSLPDGTVDTEYNLALTATGGTGPYTFALTSGSLPSGLTLSSAGILSGQPQAAGSSTFTVSATDSSTGLGPYVGSQSFTLDVASLDGITFTNESKQTECTGVFGPTGVADDDSFPDAVCSSNGNAGPGTYSWNVEFASGTPSNPTPFNVSSLTLVAVTSIVAHGTNNGQPPTLTSPPVAVVPAGSSTAIAAFSVGNIGNGDSIEVTVAAAVGGSTYSLTIQVH